MLLMLRRYTGRIDSLSLHLFADCRSARGSLMVSRMLGPANVRRVLNTVRSFFPKHWRCALILRDRLRLSEEAFHLLLATLIGIVGALTNLTYHAVSQLTKWLVL